MCWSCLSYQDKWAGISSPPLSTPLPHTLLQSALLGQNINTITPSGGEGEGGGVQDFTSPTIRCYPRIKVPSSCVKPPYTNTVYSRVLQYTPCIPYVTIHCTIPHQLIISGHWALSISCEVWAVWEWLGPGGPPAVGNTCNYYDGLEGLLWSDPSYQHNLLHY